MRTPLAGAHNCPGETELVYSSDDLMDTVVEIPNNKQIPNHNYQKKQFVINHEGYCLYFDSIVNCRQSAC